MTVTYNANAWVIKYTGSAAAGFTLPYKLYPGATEPNLLKPFLPKRMVWNSGDSGAAGNKVIIQDSQANDFALFISTGADYEPPQEWKRAKDESGPIGAIITQMDAGELIVYI